MSAFTDEPPGGERWRSGPSGGWVRGGRRWALLLSTDLAGLAGLAAYDLAGVADTLALVGLGLALRADACRDVADQLLVDARHREAGRGLDLERDAGGRLNLDRMAVAQVELQLLADELGTVPHAGDLEALAVPGRDAGDHVGHQRAGQSVQLARALVVSGPLDDERVAVADEIELRRDLTGELASGAFHIHARAVDG